MATGGGLKSPRLSPSMLDLALEARGLIQLEGRGRKASEGGGSAVASSSSGFATPSTLGSVPPSPLSVSQNSTATTASSATSTSQTGSSTSGSSSRHVSESPKSPSVGYSPSSPVPTSPLPPLPTDSDWRPPFSPKLSSPSSTTTTTAKEDLKGLGVGMVGASGGEGRGRRGWNSGEGQISGGDGFGGAGRGEMPSGPNRPRRVDDGSNTNGGGGGARDGDDGRRDDDRRIDRSTLEDDSDSDEDSSSSASSSSDDEDAASNSRRPPAVTSPRVEADSDDDVPLAVAHPAALTVQKSLRLSRRKEKHERKLREKKLERGNRSPPSRRRDAPPTSNSTTSAAGTDPHHHQSTRDAQRREREPKKELPSAYGAGQEGVFVAEELERKLLAHLNEGAGSTVRARKASSSGTKSRGEVAYGYEESGGNSRPGEASTLRSRMMDPTSSRMMEKSRTLPLPPPPPPMDITSQPSSTTTTHTSAFGALNLGRAKSQSAQPSASSSTRTRGASNQPFPSSSTTNASHDRPLMRRRPSEPVPAPTSATSPPMPPPLPASTNFPLPPPRPRPSLPHLLTSSSNSPGSANRPSPPRSPVPVTVTATETTRMFLEKMGGRAVEVEVGNATTAGMVLEGLRRKGELGGREGEEMMNGGWSVWEGGNDWGIERPLREYELLTEVSSSWNNETRLNAFIIKRCKVSSLLTLQAIPNQPPNIIGWVQMEIKKGSWKKRFLEIREGSVWICKNDRGKDEQFLCSMSAYDVYSFTRPYKAPKGRVWGLKSREYLCSYSVPASRRPFVSRRKVSSRRNDTLTFFPLSVSSFAEDKIQFFEEPKDYIHIFTSSDERTWETMWRGITSARVRLVSPFLPVHSLSSNQADSAPSPSPSPSPVLRTNALQPRPLPNPPRPPTLPRPRPLLPPRPVPLVLSQTQQQPRHHLPSHRLNGQPPHQPRFTRVWGCGNGDGSGRDWRIGRWVGGGSDWSERGEQGAV
ncbi:hypothetical protein BDY24DRAFT_24877 [Mrakia frigida]|uniref:uncharacterized protein n=1 Tax=Mrakia frigida TaxID=29902 RepID=UPI003FCC047C